jgi:hypothetical protein
MLRTLPADLGSLKIRVGIIYSITKPAQPVRRAMQSYAFNCN